MIDEFKLESFEKAARLLKDHCFEKLEEQSLKADYEVRSLEVFELAGKGFLSFGDKRGRLQVYNRETGDSIINETLGGTIDILSFKDLPGNGGLLFVGIRFKGMYVYHFEKGELGRTSPTTIFKEKKFISFFYPNIAFDKKGKPVRFEIWICLDDGDFRIYSGSFPGEQWKEKERRSLSYVLESYTIDRNKNDDATSLFLGNSAGDVFYMPLSEKEGISFPKNLIKTKILTINGAVIERMIPLSGFRKINGNKSPGELFYPQYSGCMIKLNNKIICVYFDRKQVHQGVFTLTKSFPNRLLDIKCLPFSDCCYTVVSDIENKLHLIKNITDMKPPGKNIEAIFSGELHNLWFNDRIFRFCFASYQKEETGESQILYKAYLGMGDHRVIPHNIYDYNEKLKEAEKIFSGMFVPAPKDIDKTDAGKDSGKILRMIEEILEKFRYEASGTAVKQLILQLLAEQTKGFCANTQNFLLKYKDEFSRIFYKIIENEKIELVIKASDFLTHVEQYCTLSPEVITELQVHVNKFILDKRSYSTKSENIKQLVEYNETSGNLVDALVYRGILYDRQYDPLSHIDFNESDGEITQAVPFENKLIVCTGKGKLFLVDFNILKKRTVFQYKKNGQHQGGTYNKIDNIYKGRTKIFLFVHDGRIVIFNSNALSSNYDDKTLLPPESIAEITLPSWTEQRETICYGTSACRMPHHKNKGDECLVGTNRGTILHISPSGKALELYRDSADTYAILDLRSYQTNNRFFFAAGYWNGIVKVFEFFPGRSKDQIALLERIPVDANAVNRLYVFFDKANIQSPLIVAGTDSGRCYGIRMRFDKNEKDHIHFVYEWCYRCVKAVKGIHPFSLSEDQYYILIASMDNNLHILKRNGISVNTIHLELPLTQVYIPGLNTESKPGNIDGYITTSDNRFHKTRFYLKEEIMNKINDCFSGNRKGYEEFRKINKEITLLKFKSIGINEDHFKIRYYLKSENFNSPGSILDEIEVLFESGSGKFKEKTHALKALIQKLFSSYFSELLDDKKSYERTKRLFKQTIYQWDYEGSENNSKAQLYWIRSMFKGCRDSGNPVLMFNRWFKVSEEVAIESGIREADPSFIIRHFIIHPRPFFRTKALQYIHKYITSPIDKIQGLEKTKWESGLVEALSGAVIKVLKMSRTRDNEAPLWFELEAVRFLTWMVVNYKTTGLCPAKLCINLWENEISPSFFSRLADAILIYREGVKERESFASMFQAAGRLLRQLERENPRIDEIFTGLTEFCLNNCEISSGSQDQNKENSIRDELCREFLTFFQSISKLLSYKKIDNFKDTSKLEKLPSAKESKHFKSSIRLLNEFHDLSQHIKKYYNEKHEDIYTLGKLSYETFYKIKNSINKIDRAIEQLKQKKKAKQGLWLETELYSFVLNQWGNFIKDEVDNDLILDFARAIKENNAQCIGDNTSMDIPLIFKNIFTRLNIMAECDESYLLFLKSEGNETVVIYNDGEQEEILTEEGVAAHRIPLTWLDRHKFPTLKEDEIKRQFTGKNFKHMLLEAPDHELDAIIAVYVFFWNKSDSNGFSRLESREILGKFLTTTAYLQSALREQRERQEEFFRIVSHELNQIIRGLLAWVSNLQTGKLEDNPGKRKDYYERFQFSLILADHVIRSLLSFRDVPRCELKACNLDEEIEKIVKLARIQYRDHGIVQLDFNPEVGADFEIITDPALVGTAVMNLLTNARKYNPDLKPVELSMYTYGHKIVIEVEDQGVGIPNNEYNIVFKKFARGSFAIINKIDGLGIGLAASKNNIELLGGKIKFQSREGEGSVFSIILSKKAFNRPNILVTGVEVTKAPDFTGIEKHSLKKKIKEKLNYDPDEGILTLKGAFTDEQYRALIKCCDSKDITGDFYLKALKTLHQESQKKLRDMQAGLKNTYFKEE